MTLKEIQEEIISILGNLVDEKTRGFIEKQLEYSKFEKVFSYINYMALKKKTKQDLINVFVPTTPNPTSGFLLMVPNKDLIYLDMNFEEASKFIMSAGSINPGSKQ